MLLMTPDIHRLVPPAAQIRVQLWSFSWHTSSHQPNPWVPICRGDNLLRNKAVHCLSLLNPRTNMSASQLFFTQQCYHFCGPLMPTLFWMWGFGSMSESRCPSVCEFVLGHFESVGEVLFADFKDATDATVWSWARLIERAFCSDDSMMLATVVGCAFAFPPFQGCLVSLG